jgi:hypothetical protein
MTQEKEEKDKKPKKDNVIIPDAETKGDEQRPNKPPVGK